MRQITTNKLKIIEKLLIETFKGKVLTDKEINLLPKSVNQIKGDKK